MTVSIAAQFDPAGKPFDDVYASFRQAREEAPVFYSDRYKVWVVTRYDDVVQTYLLFLRWRLVEGSLTPDGYAESAELAREALPALMLPVVLLGCLYTGITTPTEAAGLAAAYALLISVVLYRSIGWGDLYDALISSARISISIGMLIAGALVFNYVITVENIPASLSRLLAMLDLSPLGFLLLVNLILLLLGCILEGSTIILVILPVLLPTAVALGVDPVHSGVVAVLNIMIGLVTPPYGLLLFMMTKIADISLMELVREMVPFLVVMVGALALVTLWPDMVLFLPRMAGYTG